MFEDDHDRVCVLHNGDHSVMSVCVCFSFISLYRHNFARFD